MLTVDLKQLQIKHDHLVLDLGCGEGRHAISTFLLTDASHVVGVDLSLEDVAIARQRLGEFPKPSNKHCDLFVANGLQLPFVANSFDVVICSEVLEHIPSYEAMLDEINRVVKPNGILAVSVPRAWPERICWWLSRAYHQVEGGHIRIFNAAHLKREIEGKAFTYQHKHWAHALHTPYWWLRCMFWNKGEPVFLARWYHKILVWDLMKKPWLTQTLEKCLNPLMGKSVVMYFIKENK